jgi:hypothetical protein
MKHNPILKQIIDLWKSQLVDYAFEHDGVIIQMDPYLEQDLQYN